MTLASSSSASRPEPAGNAEQTSAMNTSEKEWYSSVNKKREEGHRSGWMNKMAILLVRVERGDSDHITELLKQFLDYSKMYVVFQLCFVVIFSESYDKSQKTGSGIAPKKEWLSSWKSLKKAWRETREWIEPEHIMMLTEQLFRIFKRLYCLQILQKIQLLDSIMISSTGSFTCVWPFWSCLTRDSMATLYKKKNYHSSPCGFPIFLAQVAYTFVMVQSGHDNFKAAVASLHKPWWLYLKTT